MYHLTVILGNMPFFVHLDRISFAWCRYWELTSVKLFNLIFAWVGFVVLFCSSVQFLKERSLCFLGKHLSRFRALLSVNFLSHSEKRVSFCLSVARQWWVELSAGSYYKWVWVTETILSTRLSNFRVLTPPMNSVVSYPVSFWRASIRRPFAVVFLKAVFVAWSLRCLVVEEA